MTHTPESILQWLKEKNIEYVDIQFGDLFGRLHHITFIAKELEQKHLIHGVPFDGSSIRAWKGIEKSDMIFLPDLQTVFIDPFRERKTAIFYGDIVDPKTSELYTRSPRSILKRSVEYLRNIGIGDQIFFGPEPEFFIFDKVNYEVSPHRALHEVYTVEGAWNSTSEAGLHGHVVQHKEGYLPVSPQDSLMDIRSEITSNMMNMNMIVNLHHHEVATGQNEIGINYNESMYAGDDVHKYKYAVKNTANTLGKSATFMPKPLFGDNGSGMHVHTSIWKNETNLFAGDKYGNLSELALFAIGGLLLHGRHLQAFTNPTINSYKRLVPGYEAPVRLAYSATNRSAAVRIPYVHSDKERRFEFRCGDSSGSPYLSFAAITMAMIDGIRNKIHPGESLDKNIYDMPAEELKEVNSTCNTLDEAINELDLNRDFLTAGDVFSDDLIDAYIAYKKKEELEPMKLYPNALEYKLYYSI